MLSIEDIKNVSFRRASFGGYKPEDVDNFIDVMESSYEKLLDERAKLLKEIEEINKIVSKYREEEGSIRNAILAAQKLADSSIKDAKDKAENIVNDAKLNVEKEKIASQKIYSEVGKFKNNLLKLYEEHIRFIKNIPSKSATEEKSDSILEIKRELINKVCINEPKSSNSDVKEITINDDNCIDSGRVAESESNKKKFENLKFGSDYNVKVESESRPKVGLFKHRK